ncbi:C4-dicarboxylate ABC transporter substrate-binding protein [Rhizocola hellebori]|uniref:C4-dicarboxylate ABC transporter substrate-binding protein n=1 Tax=Rhizocola hellebori TaxID=1392758 RepID=A0A8J3QBE6_9ACTN|nr:TAXI family TRAP transporter solute-binding subunit [Rhizocola hellebori]GIH06485.1 C4-dicarboxylate ABC transporter substrate-binding protein [Rhizocola hellebori]
MKRRTALALALLATTGSACSRLDPPDIEHLTIAAGPEGSVYYTLGKALAKAAQDEWGMPTHVLTTTESVDNLRYVGEGEADLGFATVDTCVLARLGDYPFDAGQPVNALGGLYEDYLHIVVRADSAILAVSDLLGKVISTGLGDSGTQIVSSRVLEAARLFGMPHLELSIVEASQALAAGRIDAFFSLGGVPTPEIAKLAQQLPIRVLPVPAELIKMQGIYGWTYLSRSIQPGIYQLKTEVETIGIPNVIVVRDDIPDTTAYRFTELLFAAKQRLAQAHPEAGRLDQRSALATYSVPLHPGAALYYRQAKPLV